MTAHSPLSLRADDTRSRDSDGGTRRRLVLSSLSRDPTEPKIVDSSRHPVHVTLRMRDDVPSLRRKKVFPAIAPAIHLASGEAFRVVHYSVQGDHVHLLVEAADKETLPRGMQGLVIRMVADEERPAAPPS
jgi:hypothetical protein